METLIHQNAASVHGQRPLNAEFTRLRDALQTVSAEKIICFGSVSHQTVRKSCFADEVHASSAVSSYHLLVVPAEPQAVSHAVLQRQVEDALKPDAEVTVLVHTMDEVNAALREGSTFFTTVYRKGTLLYDLGTIPFHPGGEGQPIVTRISRREHFWNKWHGLANGFLLGADFYATNGLFHLSVYMLHQAIQHAYCGTLRVMVGYRTNAQHLNRLQRLMETMVPHLSLAFPRKAGEDAQLYELLSKGFGDARYKETFEASPQQVTALTELVTRIVGAADTHCRGRIQQLKTGEVSYKTT
ncbi:hypothetical protein [Parapedobacter lycopersici]|uniref:hypothetical protein n=1 Tax=Parapedobacter lycopersici TaxID=1864939 RepID=UPI00214DB58A|nr:hypothetical protein [Parapedobacter lycopersici]